MPQQPLRHLAAGLVPRANEKGAFHRFSIRTIAAAEINGIMTLDSRDGNPRENSVQIAFRIVYACAVAILVVLFVVLGTLTFYPEPDSPYNNAFFSQPPYGS